MSIVCVISDIHCHVSRFEKCLKAISQKADMVLCTGDFAGYGVELDEVRELAEKYGVKSIAGNHDLYAISRMEPTIPRRSLMESVRRSRLFLSDASREYLSGLPESMDIELDGNRIVLCHGSLNSPEEYLRGVDEALTHIAESKVRRLGAYKAECFFFGHTHEAYVHSEPGLVVANPGAVGYPRSGEKPTYINFDTQDPVGSVELISF